MTEAEWLAAENLWDQFQPYEHRDRERLRALACACARHVLGVLGKPPHPSLPAVVEVAERYVGGRASRPELLAARKSLRAAIKELAPASRRSTAVGIFAELTDDSIEGFEYMLQSAESVLRKALGKRFRDERHVLSALVRCTFGNPFRPVTFAPAWRTSAAVGVAQQMYDARDFAAMPILADALQDAGCEDADVLAHCRGTGPHARGCWVVDGVLGNG